VSGQSNTVRVERPPMVNVGRSDFDAIATYAVRYCIGRMSYAPSQVQQIVRFYWHGLSDPARVVIVRDVTEAIDDAERSGRLLGMDFDHRGWVEFRDWMKAQPIGGAR
jgi:hypothetical protein